MVQYHRLFGLKICEQVLKVKNNLNRTLQLESLSAAEVQQLYVVTSTTLKKIKTEEVFDLFFRGWSSFDKRQVHKNHHYLEK